MIVCTLPVKDWERVHFCLVRLNYSIEMKQRQSKPTSVIALIVVNLFPIFGVIYWGWELFPIMLLYWSENVIIGFYNVLRMIACSPKPKVGWFAKLFLIPFFIIHYGGFTIGHGAVIVTFFGQPYFEGVSGPRLEILWQIVRQYGLPYAMLSIFLSHGYSFVMNFLRKGEYKQVTLQRLMMRPYGRIVILHVTLIFGAFIIEILKSPLIVLLLFILLKIMIDLWAHMREHRFKGKRV